MEKRSGPKEGGDGRGGPGHSPMVAAMSDRWEKREDKKEGIAPNLEPLYYVSVCEAPEVFFEHLKTSRPRMSGSGSECLDTGQRYQLGEDICMGHIMIFGIDSAKEI